MKRRDFLSAMSLGGAAAVGGGCRPTGEAPSPTERASGSFTPDVELALTASPGAVQILPGEVTPVWRYSATVAKGPADVLQSVPNSYLGPSIRLRTGQKVRIDFANQVPDSTIVHWHGLHVPEAMDGHPRFLINGGQHYIYEFEVVNRAGTYWYHPHHHNRTGPQVYRGLAGLLLVSDSTEAALGLPSGADDLVCVLQDRTFDGNNQLLYSSFIPMASMAGFLGDRVLVNGQADPSWSLSTRAYRVRLLNGSNSRVYKLAWDDATPMTIIGTDGGLLQRPLAQRYLTLIPGERADIILDLTDRPVGTSLRLQSVAFPSAPFDMGMGMMRGRGRGMMGGPRGPGAAPANGEPLSLLSIKVQRRELSAFTLPATLSSFDDAWQPGPLERPARALTLRMGMMQWLLNGRTFELDGLASNETVALGSKEIWEFDNTAAGMMGMRLAHPMHLHGRQFRILDRRVEAAYEQEWESLREGFTDDGWKDTVLVMPGERVRILVRFTRYPGLFLYHCHNLEHEDMGMMRNYRVMMGPA